MRYRAQKARGVKSKGVDRTRRGPEHSPGYKKGVTAGETAIVVGRYPIEAGLAQRPWHFFEFEKSDKKKRIIRKSLEKEQRLRLRKKRVARKAKSRNEWIVRAWLRYGNVGGTPDNDVDDQRMVSLLPPGSGSETDSEWKTTSASSSTIKGDFFNLPEPVEITPRETPLSVRDKRRIAREAARKEKECVVEKPAPGPEKGKGKAKTGETPRVPVFVKASMAHTFVPAEIPPGEGILTERGIIRKSDLPNGRYRFQDGMWYAGWEGGPGKRAYLEAGVEVEEVLQYVPEEKSASQLAWERTEARKAAARKEKASRK